jgi:UDP-glucose 4-epimerase
MGYHNRVEDYATKRRFEERSYMTWLIAGGSGYIGSHVVQQLLSSGFSTLIFDNFSRSNHELVKANSQIFRGDITSTEDLKKVFEAYEIEGVINLAALKSVSESAVEPKKYDLVNNLGAKLLIDFSIEHHVPYFLQSSTAAVYGSPINGVVNEESPTNPISIYGKTKLMAENYLNQALLNGKIKGTSLRYFNVVGAKSKEFRDTSVSNLFPIVQKAITERCPIDIFGKDYDTPDGTCIRDYIHVEDLANAHLLTILALREKDLPLSLNIGTGRGFSVLEIVSEMLKFHSLELPIQIKPRREGDPAKLIANVDLAKNKIDFVAELGLSKMISTTY